MNNQGLYCLFYVALTLSFPSIFAASTLMDHDPIIVIGDAGFSALGFPGSGTVEDPYRIEGYHIVTDSQNRNAVEVHDTNAYFLVRGCVIEADYIGVLIEDSASDTCKIVDNVISSVSGDGGGISITSDGVYVVNNTCSGFVVGVHTNYANGCVFMYNNFSYNAYHGVNLRFSDDCLVAHNDVVKNGAHGIFIIRESTGNVVYNNTISGNSALKSYEWDDIYSFTVNSQGCDEGSGNTWYDVESQTGNKWSDYTGTREYLIDGSAKAVDRYPVTVKTSSVEPPPGRDDTIPGFDVLAIFLGVTLSILIVRFSHLSSLKSTQS